MKKTKKRKKVLEKVVVTGGAGFIGSHLVKKLVELGFDVFVIDNLYSGKVKDVHPKAKFFNLDVRDLDKIRPVFKGAKYVFHLAAIPSVQFSIEHPGITNDVNVNGALNVLTAAKDACVKRVIYSASSSVYGDVTKLPIMETKIADPKSPYAVQKYMGELYCKMFSEIYGLETVCLRYFNAYGKGQSVTGPYSGVISVFLEQKKQGKKLTIVGDGMQTRDFVHVSDVVNANILAAKSEMIGKGESINIGTGKRYSVKDIAKIIGGPIEYLLPRIEPKDSLADISLAKFLLDWEPKIDLEKGLKELL